jgi:hypothetical protein
LRLAFSVITVNVDNRRSDRDCNSYVVEERLGDIMIEIKAEEDRKKRYNAEVDRTLTLKNLFREDVYSVV